MPINSELKFRTEQTRFKIYIFTALRGMQTRSSNENLSVRPSVCPFKRVNCDKTEKLVQIFIPYERSFSIVFL